MKNSYFFCGKLLASALFYLLSHPLFTQNLIPNSSFEKHYSTPRTLNKSGAAFTKSIPHWFAPNQASTDLITPLFKSEIVNLIKAQEGKNVVGLLLNSQKWAEYVGIELPQKLEKGKQYYFECWLAIPDGYKEIEKGQSVSLNDNFGLLYGDNLYFTNTQAINAKPQVTHSTLELEPAKWTKFKAVFTAEKESQFLYFGQFCPQNIEEPFARGYFFVDNFLLEPFFDISQAFKPPQLIKDSLNNIFFETNKSILKESAFDALNHALRFLKAHPDLKVKINGHTDNRGEDFHNMVLSKARAEAVKNYFVKKGIPENRLLATGYGATSPLSDNGTPEGRQQNRRVVFEIVNQKKKATSNFTGLRLERLYENYQTQNLKPLVLPTIENKLGEKWISDRAFDITYPDGISFLNDLINEHKTLVFAIPQNQPIFNLYLARLIKELEVESINLYGNFDFLNKNSSKAIHLDDISRPLSFDEKFFTNTNAELSNKLHAISVDEWKLKKMLKLTASQISDSELQIAKAKAMVWVAEIKNKIAKTETINIILFPYQSKKELLFLNESLEELFKMKIPLIDFAISSSSNIHTVHYRNKPRNLNFNDNYTYPQYLISVPKPFHSFDNFAHQYFKEYHINLDKWNLDFPSKVFIFENQNDYKKSIPWMSFNTQNSDFYLQLPKGEKRIVTIKNGKYKERVFE